MTAGRLIEAARVLTPEGWIGPAAVEVDEGLIAGVHPRTTARSELTLLPGFVDLQVNGIADVDVATADPAGYERLGGLLAAQGTTTWCPTLISAPPERYEPWLQAVARAGAAGDGPAIAGAHLEGPFLGSLPGAHDRALIRPPDPGWLETLLGAAAVVTMGAEHPGAPATCRELTRGGTLVALGHTAPDTRQVEASIDAGARMVTHCFNATGAISAREPGLAGVALADERLAVSLIADLVHVHPLLLGLAFRCKGPENVCLVTDSVAWERGELGGEPVQIRDGAPRRPDGTLAGSCLGMDGAVRNLVAACGVSLEDAARAASTTPARLLRLGDRGAIAPGLRADLVALGPDLAVRATWIAGRCRQFA